MYRENELLSKWWAIGRESTALWWENIFADFHYGKGGLVH